MNGYLLDTHILLWWQNDAPELSSEIRMLIGAPSNPVFVSAATVWEIGIKLKVGKLELPTNWRDILNNEPFEHLPITFNHAFESAALPNIHKDPFDRMLVAQARCESLALITKDKQIGNYDVAIVNA